MFKYTLAVIACFITADRGRTSQCLSGCVGLWRLSKVFIQRSVMPHQRLSKSHLLFEFPGKIKILYSFCKHAYWTERPVLKWFGINMRTITPIIYMHACTHTHTHTHTHTQCLSIHPNAMQLINDHVNLKTFAFTVKIKGWGVRREMKDK